MPESNGGRALLDKIAAKRLATFNEEAYEHMDMKEVALLSGFALRNQMDDQSKATAELLTQFQSRMMEIEATQTQSIALMATNLGELKALVDEQGIKIRITPKALTFAGTLLVGVVAGIGKKVGWWL